MTLLVALGASVAAAVVVWPLTRALGRGAGWPLALLYLGGLAALAPSAGAVFRGAPGPEATIAWVPERGWNLVLVAEPIGMLFAVLALGIGALVLIYSAAYLPPHPPAQAGTVPAHEPPPAGTPLATAPGYGFYQLMTIFTASMLVLVLTDSLAALFIAWEMTSLASFGLILNSGRPAFRAATRTLSATFIGGLCLLAAVGLIWTHTRTDRISVALHHPVWQERPGLLVIAALLVAVAALSKSAQFPFHYWLPGAMAAATPVSAYLHAAAVVKAGIFVLMRFSPLFHTVALWHTLLVTVGLGTAIMAALFALQKYDLKQLMAYSTVSQLGWIVAAIGVGTDIALAAAALHTFAHALFKSGLFMLTGVVDHQAHTRDLRELRRIPGRVRALPWTFTAVLLGAAGMAGLPPLLGFVSKEAMLTAYLSLDDGGLRHFAVIAATVGAMLTFAYCARIVVAGFLDTDTANAADAANATDTADTANAATGHSQHRRLREAHPALLLPAAIPAVAGLPLVLTLGPLGHGLEAFAAAAVGHHSHAPHLSLWHGVTPELLLTLLILSGGIALTLARRPLERLLDRELLPTSGNRITDTVRSSVIRIGAEFVYLNRTDSPPRHVAALLGTMTGFGLIGMAQLIHDGSLSNGTLPPLRENLDRNSDLLVLAVVAIAVTGMCVAASRIAAVVLLSAAGISVTILMFSLGAPDVGITQLMVEAITVIVFMLMLRRLPATFKPASAARRAGGALLALLVGGAATTATLLLTARRDKAPLGTYLFDQTEPLSGGTNVVNVILVEFRALDTFGELSVLGMAGIAILAVTSSLRARHRDPADAETVALPVFNHRGRGAAARALADARRNSAPLRLLTRVSAPMLFLVAALLFWRGHTAPGGGFIAALVASAGVILIYLSRPTDRPVSRPGTAPRLIGAGLLAAALTGFAGMAWGTFLEPAHGHILHQHLSTAMVFDAGVFLAVIGLVMVTLNLLGTGRLRPNQESHPDEPNRGPAPAPEQPAEPVTEHPVDGGAAGADDETHTLDSAPMHPDDSASDQDPHRTAGSGGARRISHPAAQAGPPQQEGRQP